MNVPDIRWKVKVLCKKDRTKNHELAEALVTFQPPDKDPSKVGSTLRITEVGNPFKENPFDGLYVQAKVLGLTPRQVLFTARWWSSDLTGKRTKFTLGPEVRVECTF